MNGYQARAAAMELRVRGGRLLSSWDAGSAVLQKDAEALLAAAKHLDAYAAAYFDAKRIADSLPTQPPPQPAAVKPRCENCRWWEWAAYHEGVCKRFPPTRPPTNDASSLRWKNSVTGREDYCGEFSPRENV